MGGLRLTMELRRNGRGNRREKGSVLDRIAGTVAAAALSVTLVAAGFAACAGPDAATAALSQAFSADEESPFTKGELVEAAVSTKGFVTGSLGRAELFGAVADINQRAALDGRAGEGAPDLSRGFHPAALEASFSQADERYVLSPDAVSHLDDVRRVIEAARLVLAAVAAVAAAACAAVSLRQGARALGRALMRAGTGVLALFALLAAWAAVDFNGFFAAFHSLFFAQGTWTFPWDSLLITMYPSAFWIGMGAIWLATTSLLCLASIAAGWKLGGRTRAANGTPSRILGGDESRAA